MKYITVSNWLADLLRLRYRADVVAVIPNGIDPSTAAKVRKQPSQPTIGFHLNDELSDSIPTIKHVIQLLGERLNHFRVVVYGEKSLLEGIKLPVNSQVFTASNKTSLRQVQAQCDAWLYYHHAEAFADEVVAALAEGTPVVATTSGDTQSILANGGGHIVPIDHAKSMSDALYDICTLSTSEWQAVSTQAKQVAAEYSHQKIGRKLNVALFECLEQSVGAAPVP